MENKVLVIVVAATVTLLVGAGGFLLGTRIGATRQTGQLPGAPGMGGGPGGGFVPGAGAAGRGGGPQGGFRSGPDGTGMVSGKIISKDKSSVTVSLPEGGSKIVYISGSTRYQTISRGSAAEMSVGETVTAFGTTGSDGGVTARAVTIQR